MLCSSTGVRRTNAAPAPSSSRHRWPSAGWSSGPSATRSDSTAAAATRKVTASTMATAAPPASANSVAPTSGPTSRRPSRVMLSDAFTSTSTAAGSMSLSRPLRAAGTTTNETP